MTTFRDRAQMGLVILCCAAFAMLAALIPADFFISKVQWDFLYYFLMSEKIAETGHPFLSVAVNSPQIKYASGAAYVYAPAMAFFQSYDWRLRALQIENLALFACYLTLTFQYFRQVLPARVSLAATVLFAIASLLDLRTFYLVMMPNSDIVPAIVTVAAFLVASSTRVNDWQKFLLIVALCAPAFFIKMSVIVLPIAFSIILMLKGKRNLRRLALGVPLIIALLFLLNWETAWFYVQLAVNNYLFPQGQISLSGFLTIIGTDAANLVFVSLPESVIPNFGFLFFQNASSGSTALVLGEVNARVAAGMIAGGVTSIMIVLGAMRLWKAQTFALLSLALALPIFALIADGTSRYLVSYLPLLWCCLMTTAIPLVQRIRWNRITGAAGVLAVAIVLFLIQDRYVTVRSTRLGALGGLTGAFQYFGDVSAVYGGVRNYLEEQPRDRSLVIFSSNFHYQSTVWTAVSGVESYDVSKARPGWNDGKRAFLVLACRVPWCGEMLSLKQEAQTQLGGDCAVLMPRAQWTKGPASAEIFEFTRDEACPASAL